MEFTFIHNLFYIKIYFALTDINISGISLQFVSNIVATVCPVIIVSSNEVSFLSTLLTGTQTESFLDS